LAVSALRERASALVTRMMPDFTERKASMHPFEDNRRNQIFFFRWEEAGAFEFDLPPFIQVGIHADGTLACYTDTVSGERG
jgi:hypothetical protein